MKVKIRAFTLIELILVLAIGSILLGISTNWYVTNIASANNKNNRQVDLQSSVSSSMDVIKNTLKKTSQIHLVGKNVYDPALSVEELNNTGLDVNYNYIALSKDKDTGNQTLVNIVYNKNLEGGKFEVFPLLAQERTDNLQSRNISYDMKFYKGDGDYRSKLDKNILNLTLIGNAHDVDENGQPVNSQNDILFQLSEDIYMQNINQILVSKHFEGGIDEVTAIAYDNQIVHGESVKNKVTKMSFVFAIDNSGSMEANMNGKYKGVYQDSRRQIARDSILKFIDELHKSAKKSGIDVDAYIYSYGGYLVGQKEIKAQGTDKKYIFPLPETGMYLQYGPYKLGAIKEDISNDKIKKHIDEYCRMSGMEEGKRSIPGTNTGLAILQGLEILNQVRERNGNQRTFFILLTDGVPTQFYAKDNIELRKILIKNGEKHYQDVKIPNYTFFADVRGFIKNASDFYNSIYEPLAGTDFVLIDHENKSTKYPYYSLGDSNPYHQRPYQIELNPKDGKYHRSGTLYTREKNDVGYAVPMLYIKHVTSPEAKNNRPNTFDRAYLIGFSNDASDKKMLGFGRKDFNFNYQALNDFDYGGKGIYFETVEQTFNVNGKNMTFQFYEKNNYKVDDQFRNQFCIKDNNESGSIRKYLAQEGTKFDKRKIVDVFDTDGSASLDKAFADIVQSIGDVTGAFDGPKKLIGR